MMAARPTGLHRRETLVLLAGGAAALALPRTTRAQTAKELRIGYQKFGALTLIKARGTLEQRLAPEGVSVTWTEFPAGPQLLEAMNVGSVDFAITGETPPIFGQAAGTPLVYVGYEPPSPAGEAIVVQKDSPITSVAELAGKRVALNKGSNVHYLLVRALEEAGLTIKDVEPAYLPPADARAAFDRGAVDGWVIWDPFFAVAETAAGARVVRNGEGLVKNHIFYFGTRQSLETAPQNIAAVLQELRDLAAWYRPNLPDAIAILQKETGVDPGSLERAFARLNLGVQPVTADVVAEQQRIADVFYDLGIVPKHVEVAEAVSSQTF